MKGESLTYRNFVVFPENSGHLQVEMLTLSKIYSMFFYFMSSRISVNKEHYTLLEVLYSGKLVHSRYKYRIPEIEKDILPGGTKPTVISLEGVNVLPLICYELLFPEDYLITGKRVDLIIHQVGFPMFDEFQKEGWVAVQKSIAKYYDCPLICCCGGARGNLNITGVINEE